MEQYERIKDELNRRNLVVDNNGEIVVTIEGVELRCSFAKLSYRETFQIGL